MITTSLSQDREFKQIIVYHLFENDGDNLLQEAVEYIVNTFEPDELFEKRRLESWAEENSYIHSSQINEH